MVKTECKIKEKDFTSPLKARKKHSLMKNVIEGMGSIMEGAGSIMDIMPQRDITADNSSITKYIKLEKSFLTDMEALKSDWMEVGNTLDSNMKEALEEYEMMKALEEHEKITALEEYEMMKALEEHEKITALKEHEDNMRALREYEEAMKIFKNL